MADDHAKPPAPLADLTTKLRRHKDVAHCNGCMICIAADEIERLEFERDEHRDAARAYRDEVERLRALITEWHDSRMTVDPDLIADIARRAGADNALAKEARRG